MSIYAIADLHLSFRNPKPMDIFGNNWEKHEEKIKKDWESKVKEDDLVLLPGDIKQIDNSDNEYIKYLEDTYDDFSFLNDLPGKKLLLKGNHDYWWTTVTSMRKFLKEKSFENIDFIYNNSYEYEGYIITGTRGWNLNSNEEKIFNREVARLVLSLESGIKNFGDNKKIITCMHYPPITKHTINSREKWDFVDAMKKYGVKRCLYGHLHSDSHKEAADGNVDGISFELVSADYLKFNLKKIV